jgi:peptidoglycan/xylan/chitin deacetylase (PgdA/CDA1 family)
VSGDRSSGAFTIAFDDASLSQLELGLPVLARHGVPGVVFVPTGLVGGFFRGEPILTLDQLRRLDSAGWELGSHTVTHARLAKNGVLRVSRDQLDRELTDSRAWLVEHGFQVTSFAYPYGRYSDEVEERAAGIYRYVRTTSDGLNPICAAHSRLASYNLCQRKVSRFKRAVAETARRSAWLIGVVHHVTADPALIPSEDDKSWIAASALEECVEHALAAGLTPSTFRDIHGVATVPRIAGERPCVSVSMPLA